MTDVLAYAPPRDLAAKARRRLTQWRAARPAHLRFAEPVLSICFDDFPKSAADIGARILEQDGARGSFYAAAGLSDTDGPCGRNFTAPDLARLAAAGHEIGCHSFDHTDCARRGAYETLLDLSRNRYALEAMGHTAPLQTLAYPYGETTTDLKAALPLRFICARGVLPGLNVGAVDLAHLRAYPLFGDLGRVHRALKLAAQRNAWMIVFTHDVSDTPSPWGTSGADLEALLNAAREFGLAVTPIAAALERRLP